METGAEFFFHSRKNGEENSTTQTRTLDVVTEVKSGNNTVRYEYDSRRRVKSVSLNGVEDYVTYAYGGEHTDTDTVVVTMKDCTNITTVKDRYGNVTLSSCGDRSVENTYNGDMTLRQSVDSVSGKTQYFYNGEGNVESVKINDAETERYTYDDKQLLTSKTVGGRLYNFKHKPTADKSLASIEVDEAVIRPNTDALGRNTGKTIEVGTNKIAEEKISYVKFGDHATNLPSNVRFATNGVFKESTQYRYAKG